MEAKIQIYCISFALIYSAASDTATIVNHQITCIGASGSSHYLALPGEPIAKHKALFVVTLRFFDLMPKHYPLVTRILTLS